MHDCKPNMFVAKIRAISSTSAPKPRKRLGKRSH
jgi:hypothetical protein